MQPALLQDSSGVNTSFAANGQKANHGSPEAMQSIVIRPIVCGRRPSPGASTGWTERTSFFAGPALPAHSELLVFPTRFTRGVTPVIFSWRSHDLSLGLLFSGRTYSRLGGTRVVCTGGSE